MNVLKIKHFFLVFLLLLTAACGGASKQLLDGAGPVADQRAPQIDAAARPDAEHVAAPRVVFVDGEGKVVSRIRYGDPFSLRVEGLTPREELVLASRLGSYASQVVFDVPEDGVVDTARDAPTRGSYSGVAPEGIVWSMRFVEQKELEDLHVRVTASCGSLRIDAQLERSWLDEGLTRVVVEEQGVVAVLYLPDAASGPLPGLIVLGGSEGGIESAAFQAAWLAGYGYAAMAVAYFGLDGLPADLERVPVETVGKALELLADRPGVDGARLGVFGASRGSELALMAGARYPSVGAVVAVAPSGVRWGAASGNGEPAWTYGAEALPYLHGDDQANPVAETLPGGAKAYRFTPVFEASLDGATAQELADATIAAEKTRGGVLLLAGADDGLWPSCRMARITLDRLAAAGHTRSYGDRLICYEDAGHVAPQPGWPTAELYVSSWGSYYLVMGGSDAGNARAQRQGLVAMRSFLEAQLRQ